MVFGLKLLLDLFNPIEDAKRQRVGIIGAIQAIGVLGEKGRNHLINTDGTFYSYGGYLADFECISPNRQFFCLFNGRFSARLNSEMHKIHSKLA